MHAVRVDPLRRSVAQQPTKVALLVLKYPERADEHIQRVLGVERGATRVLELRERRPLYHQR
jgi:hypothetical protein